MRAALSLFILLTACDWIKKPAAASDDSVQVEWAGGPASCQVGPCALKVNVTDKAGAVKGARVHVEANMTHPGMAPAFAEAKETGDGIYSFNIELSMAGEWIFFLKVKKAGGGQVERNLKLAQVK